MQYSRINTSRVLYPRLPYVNGCYSLNLVVDISCLYDRFGPDANKGLNNYCHFDNNEICIVFDKLNFNIFQHLKTIYIKAKNIRKSSLYEENSI